MGFHGQQSPLLLPLLVLVTCVQPGTNLESINYVPQLSSDILDGRLTQSTFALEQPLGQFENVSLSDWDPIWLVVAHSNATQSFAAPQKVEDTHAPANFDRNGYYLTMRTSWVYYKASQPDSQLRVLRVLRVGNDNSCSLMSRGCNAPLPRAGPYRVKFLAMSAKGPVAETKWSEEIYLQQAQTFQGAPGSQSKGAVVIIAFSSILLAILLAVFLVLVISAYCWGTAVSSPEEQVRIKRYRTHHVDSLRAERSS
ncbi:uroplakin-3b-like protein 1 [Acomys russatus]|uniref:uroplakin-3b-like protein 1 n=1 Tax=Acomys russatus TaxID=60746 RepID=UPI0021E28CED|nr:uroplakin-3b-like protein 1 [Acomys russatus]